MRAQRRGTRIPCYDHGVEQSPHIQKAARHTCTDHLDTLDGRVIKRDNLDPLERIRTGSDLDHAPLYTGIRYRQVLDLNDQWCPLTHQIEHFSQGGNSFALKLLAEITTSVER